MAGEETGLGATELSGCRPLSLELGGPSFLALQFLLVVPQARTEDPMWYPLFACHKYVFDRADAEAPGGQGTGERWG